MEFELQDERATQQFAEDLALCLQKGDMVTLSGDLGAGKSTFARALIRTLADDEKLDVPSPTFTLVQVYEETRIALAHADIYRLETAEELEELGLEEFRQNGIIVLEWPEKLPNIMNRAQFCLFLYEKDNNRRLLRIKAEKQAEIRLRHSLAIRAFLRGNGRGCAKRRFLQGDASPRSYEKLYLLQAGNKQKTEILMDAPPLKPQNKERAAYIKQVHLATHNCQFIAVNTLLDSQGFKVPHIYAENTTQNLLIIEDLGEERIVGKNGCLLLKRAVAAAEFLAKFHQTDWQQAAKIQQCNIPVYDSLALQTEVNLLQQWYIPYKTGKSVSKAWQQRWQELWQKLLALLPASEQSLVLRDFHSPNILWQAGEKDIRRFGLIDFQDAVFGAAAYDLVSLAQDARLTVSVQTEQRIKSAYFTARAIFNSNFDAAQYDRDYAILGAQRAGKILGAFVRLHKQDGKDHYLSRLPQIENYLHRNLQAPILSELQQFLAENRLFT